MKTEQIWNHILCYDEYDLENKPHLKDFLNTQNIHQTLKQFSEKIILVLGWDGTMLRAIRENYNWGKPFLWINFGHKWFLLNDQEWIQNNTGKYITRNYPLIEIKKNWESLWVWFNDVNIYSPNGKVLNLDISNGFWNLPLDGDGVIIATPAGSTWHSKSYGWPILLHDINALVVTPKGNLVTQSSKTVQDDKTIVVRNRDRRFEMNVNIDGVFSYQSEYGEKVSLEVQKSSQSVQLIIASDHASDWDNKLLSEQWFSS